MKDKKINSEDIDTLPKESDLFETKNYFYLCFNIINNIELTLVHKFGEIYAPSIIFKMKDFKILADIEDEIKS